MDFSIIICTYNPDYRILKRCLNAINNLQISNFEIEIILVDNNSSVPVSNNIEIKNILNENCNIKIITEKQQGLSYARIAGINNSSSPWIIFFDDDNEPNSDYLVKLNKIIKQFQNVGIWGPGNVYVDFIDGAEPWVMQNAKETFQEKHFFSTEYALQTAWNGCYPPGTGMVIKREIIDYYKNFLEEKEVTTTGRKGSSLLSAEDNQIIYSSIKMNFAIGTSPELSLKHIINKQKANLKYVKRLRYWVRVSIPKAELEFYNNDKEILKRKLKQIPLLILIIKYIIKGILNFKLKEAQINIALVLGNYSGINYAFSKNNPLIIRALIKLFKLN